ncbi:MAG TPA: 50S ribosomal protein L25/general stress protein Ctc [Candidatus Microbacterium stercoravium]|uniref:Large ribosomal subunit protein bL25 n=1 Tax=Candidatus Microbacterium stercoravium TaxID=2838697 RepID=A0A9D2KGK3_9MICO|nr:50S ribosomal protein L25/general stress protein Ctc [Candidatus Microbacterium stercoravium]
MSDENKLSAEIRTEFGKGFARRLRAAGKIPAVVYGHGSDVRHVALPAHETGLIVRYANAIITLDIDGEQQIVFVKDVQRDPVRSIIEHIDLVTIKRGEKIEVEVPLLTEGETFSGTYMTMSANTIRVLVDALTIPEHITVDVEGLEDGAQLYAKDVTLPKGAELLDDPELHLISVTANATSDEEDEAAESAEAVAENAAE